MASVKDSYNYQQRMKASARQRQAATLPSKVKGATGALTPGTQRNSSAGGPVKASTPTPAPAPTQSSGSSSRPRSSSVQAPSSRGVDWLAAQGMFRADRSKLQTDLQDTLAQILFDKQRQYRGLGTAREDWTRERGKESQALGENFAARGLLSSGLYRQGLDELMGQYQRSANQLDALQQDIAQQYGAQGSLTAIDPTSLYNADDYTALANVYGLLGQRGTSAGQQYGAALNQARAAAAARAGQSIFSQAGF